MSQLLYFLQENRLVRYWRLSIFYFLYLFWHINDHPNTKVILVLSQNQTDRKYGSQWVKRKHCIRTVVSFQEFSDNWKSAISNQINVYRFHSISSISLYPEIASIILSNNIMRAQKCWLTITIKPKYNIAFLTFPFGVISWNPCPKPITFTGVCIASDSRLRFYFTFFFFVVVIFAIIYI